MHLCPAAALLYHSLRNEQTVVIGFQMTLGKVLTSWQVPVTYSYAALSPPSILLRQEAFTNNLPSILHLEISILLNPEI
jgi:hypothetical protein